MLGRALTTPHVAACLLAVSCLLAGPASAQFPACPVHPISSLSSPNLLTTALVTSTDFTTPRSFVGAGDKLMAFDPAAHSWLWTITLSGAARCDPVPVKLKSGVEVVLVTEAGCHLACVRASDGFVLWNADLRTGLPDPADEIGGSPAVQLWNYSSSTFQSAIPNDLVFAATQYVSTSMNRVYALNATDGSARWRFNLAGTNSMNSAVAGPVVDLAHDAVYVGTNQSSAIQNSLWALKSVNGTKAWTGFGVPSGPITQRPLLAGGRLYTTGTDAILRATDADTVGGSPIWSVAFASAPASDPVLDPDSATPVLTMACAGGVLRTFVDEGAFAAELPLTAGVTSGPVYLPGAGVFYATDASGRVQSFDSALRMAIGPPANPCATAALHLSLAHTPTLAFPWWLSVVGTGGGGGHVEQLCVPWSPGQAPSECVVGVADPSAPRARSALWLAPPSPNPSHGVTQFVFEGPASRAEVRITDVLGRRVRQLSEGGPASGMRSLVWDGRDDSGHPAPAGLYTVQLLVEGAAAPTSRKVLLVR
jgi:hypothetical protein